MTQTYALKHPITRRTRVHGEGEKEQVIDEVTVRRLKAKDMKMLDKVNGKFAQALSMIGALTGLDSTVVDELDGEDVQALSEMVGDFFPGLQGSGEPS